MAKVRILPDNVANQIAAGEVVERPAAVVKELLENALDAGATRVVVEFAHAGRSLIRVEDNGHGMSREDARAALERHATSKIADVADLDRLSTFGFRGEALPSIASVSRFTIQTRESGADAGTEISINAGKVLRERACGRPVGTRIDVERLFEPVPARRKFLKTDRTEAGHIISCVRLYALACPATSFTLIEDEREIFRSPECSSLADRVAEIYGRQAAEGLLALHYAEPGMRITGLIGGPGVGRSTRHDMVAFVNSRPVDSRALNGALMESYRESLPAGRFPVAFIFLECSPSEVDVNVHPAKREVRFRSEAVVRGFVIRAVLTRLREWSGRPSAAGQASPSPLPMAPAGLPAPFQPWAGEPPQQPSAILPPLAAQRYPEARNGVPASGFPEVALDWRYVGTAHGAYVLYETPQGLVLLDRRAAHERVWYERLREQFKAGGVPVQHLLLPVSLELSPVAAAVLIDNIGFFQKHGLEVSEFGRNFFRVEAIPSWMEPGDADTFVRDLVGALREGRIPTSDPDVARDEFARLAAKAVRLSQKTEESEALALVRELFTTSSPISGPRGHPTFVELNHAELARRFQK
jgi:DNA mismatch repair protein MutL